jgi:hypothetical protein
MERVEMPFSDSRRGEQPAAVYTRTFTNISRINDFGGLK